MLPRMRREERKEDCSDVRPLMVACVPTGMNTGVGTDECGRVRVAARALEVEHARWMVKRRGEEDAALGWEVGEASAGKCGLRREEREASVGRAA